MSRDTLINERTDAILASDPMLATYEPHTSALRRALRAVGRGLILMTVGGLP